jgi:hypothetical protein
LKTSSIEVNLADRNLATTGGGDPHRLAAASRERLIKARWVKRLTAYWALPSPEMAIPVKHHLYDILLFLGMQLLSLLFAYLFPGRSAE